MATKHESWVVNVDGTSHIVSFDFSSGNINGDISVSVDNNQVASKTAASANDFNGVYPIKIGSKIANLRVKAKALAIVRGFDVELELDGTKIQPSK